MQSKQEKTPFLEEVFRLDGKLQETIFVGESGVTGRRQLVPTGEGRVSGKINGVGLPGGVDCQIIRPDGITEISAKYGIRLDNGDSFLVVNEGIRRVSEDALSSVKKGELIDPEKAYFVTTPKFEIYSENLKWLKESVFICVASRYESSVRLRFFRVNLK